jgi:parallel beta-helix repeat protein
MKKILVVGIILLFLGSNLPLLAQAQEHTRPLSHILFVGGSGPGNYTKIQDAIDASSDGDTVFVYGGIYQEQLYINNKIRLIGESKNTTTIDALSSFYPNLISINSSNVTVSGFTLQSNNVDIPIISTDNYPSKIKNLTISGNIFSINESWCILYIPYTQSCIITDNIFNINGQNWIYLRQGNNSIISHNSFNANNSMDIVLLFMGNCTVNDNIMTSSRLEIDNCQNISITKNRFTMYNRGIKVSDSQLIHISNNTFLNRYILLFPDYAILIQDSSYITVNFNIIKNTISYSPNNGIVIRDCLCITISFNIINRSSKGINLISSYGNSISNNLVYNCDFGIFIDESHDNVISKNTFENNTIHARFLNSDGNNWNENYWGRPRILPKPIFGIKDMNRPRPGFFEFDWHPARQPYNITTRGFQ